MRKRLIMFLGLLSIAVLATACRNSSISAGGQKKKAVAAGLSFDIIIGGPFAFVETTNCGPGASSCLAVMAPDVASHTGMIGLGANGELKQFKNTNYDFTTGMRPSMNSTVSTPVLNASHLTVSASNEQLPTAPVTQPYATLNLPTPREIVPWNADLMQIASLTPVPPTTPTQTFATLTILRYDFQDSDAPEIDDHSGTFWKPHPYPTGNERILLIGIIPQDPATGEDQHVHASEAFNALMAMVGLHRYINFVDPPSTFQRNRPLNPASPLPKELFNFIDSAMNFKPFGTINDCKAPALLVLP